MKSKIIIHNGELVLPNKLLEDGLVIVDDGKIEFAGKGRLRLPKAALRIDARGGIIAPGFVDIHVHGGDGADFMDGSPEAVLTAIGCHARHGTTTIFPTTTTGSPDQIEAMIQATKAVQAKWNPGWGSRIAGVHLYGPFFAADKVGCHDQAGRRDPTPDEYRRYFASKLIRIATCAAELSGADDFYRLARRHRCLVTCGHSNASWSEMKRAYQLGVRHVDHFWCAMSSVTSLRARCGVPMQASMEQFVLANHEMSTEVIADGFHLSDELLNFAYQFKGGTRLCLVTDSSRALGMQTGRYRFGSLENGSWFLFDGHVGRSLDGIGLASSASGMDQMVRVMSRATNSPLHELFRMASLTPAERSGIDKDCGSLETGKRADILLLNRKLELQRVFIEGCEFSRERVEKIA